MRDSKGKFVKNHAVPKEWREKFIPPSHTCIPHSEATIKKISESRKGKAMGLKNGNWKGGIRKIEKAIRVMPEYIKWRSDVFKRDNWTCKNCNINNVYVTAHHIKSFIQIIRENLITNIIEARNCRELWDINNGVTLCEECHKLTDNYKGRSVNLIIKNKN